MNIRVYLFLTFSIFEFCYAEPVITPKSAHSDPFVNRDQAFPVLSGGLIWLNNTHIFEGQTPGRIINVVSPSGGNGNPNFQWFMSVDGSNFMQIPGADSLEFTVPPLFESTWFRRLVTDGSSEYSNTIFVTVDFNLDGGITYSKQITVDNGSTARKLFVSSKINKRNGKCDFQWQKCDGGNTYMDISNANDSTLVVTDLTKNTWFRRSVKQNGKKEFSVATSVGPGDGSLSAGTISFSNATLTTSKNINSGDNVGYIYSYVTPSGGSGAYTYQWKQSTDDVNWVIASSTSGYPSTNLNYIGFTAIYTPTYFRLYVTDDESAATAYSNDVYINISNSNQLDPGSISINNTTTISINPGSLPGTIYGTAPTGGGGTGTYTYQWEEFVNSGSSWNNSSQSTATGQNYTPGALTQTTYFRRKVTSGSLSGYSNVVTITVTTSGENIWIKNGSIIYYSAVGGKVGIGTTQPDKTLTVNGIIHSTGVLVESSVPAPDYVFNNEYKLIDLGKLKTFIEYNKHLPEVPSSQEMKQQGVDLYEMNMIILKKIEELTLYILQLKGYIDKQQTLIDNLLINPK